MRTCGKRGNWKTALTISCNLQVGKRGREEQQFVKAPSFLFRCPLITVDQDDGVTKTDGEPLETLKRLSCCLI